MITLARFPAAEILPKIGKNPSKIRVETDSGVWYPRVDSERLELFKDNQTCVSCGLIGTLFLLQSHRANPPRVGHNCFIEECPWCAIRSRPIHLHASGDYPHFNMYAIENNGRLILMTKDHIIPKSRGGADKLSNLQTMCTICNNRKGALLPEEQAAGIRKRQIDWAQANHQVLTRMELNHGSGSTQSISHQED